MTYGLVMIEGPKGPRILWGGAVRGCEDAAARIKARVKAGRRPAWARAIYTVAIAADSLQSAKRDALAWAKEV